MRLLDGELVVAPTDLAGFAACAHLTRLELAAAHGELTRPVRDSPFLDLLARQGHDHEVAALDTLAGGRRLVVVEGDLRSRAGIDRAAAETFDAMRAGADVIYQGVLFADGRLARPDFLERVGAPSAFGPWSYEALDAKLARKPRPGALLQLCEYSEQLAQLQRRIPARFHVLTGDGARHSFVFAEHRGRHLELRARFAAALAAPDASTAPEPVGHCRSCRWAPRCAQQWERDDHVSRVAGVRGEHLARLRDAGITTRAQLAAVDPTAEIDGIPPRVFERVQRQAALQARGAREGRPLHELLEPHLADGGQSGFAVLPAPSPGDLFCDLEGDPAAIEGGIEYLFGLVELVDGVPEYHARWAHDRDAEGDAFRATVDRILEQRGRHPDAHVYHYASYEVTAFRRLARDHDSRIDELEQLVADGVFVDLHRVVVNSVRLSTASYSLKKVELLYRPRPEDAVMDAGASLVAYQRFLETRDQSLLDGIARYNADDCLSLVGLRDWLEARRAEAAVAAVNAGTVAHP